MLGRSARELVYDVPPLDGRAAQRGTARMFFDGNRLYIFYAEVTERVPARDVALLRLDPDPRTEGAVSRRPSRRWRECRAADRSRARR